MCLLGLHISSKTQLCCLISQSGYCSLCVNQLFHLFSQNRDTNNAVILMYSDYCRYFVNTDSHCMYSSGTNQWARAGGQTPSSPNYENSLHSLVSSLLWTSYQHVSEVTLQADFFLTNNMLMKAGVAE